MDVACTKSSEEMN